MAFADSKSGFEDSLGDVSLCSVCCEEFKSPRILPCGHSFCHSCIASAVNSSCEHKEAPVGFNCPLCREFIPCFGEHKEWVNLFPLNKALLYVTETNSRKLCGACKIENEDTQGVNYCFECHEVMCKTCTRYHGKIAATRNHAVSPLNNALDSCRQKYMYNSCIKHQDRLIELVCNDHDEPCCLLCAATQHRTCSSIEPLDVAAKKIKESSVIQDILSRLKSYEERLSKITFSQEKNIEEIDVESERLREEAEKLEEDLVRYVGELKNTFLDELAKVTKASKEKINRSTASLNEQLLCIKKCKQSLSDIAENPDVAEQVLELCRSKQIIRHLQASHTHAVSINFTAQKCCDFEEVKQMLAFCKLQQIEILRDINLEIDLPKAKLEKDVRFSITGGRVFHGVFLRDGSMIFPQYMPHDWMRTNEGKCYLFSNNGELLKQIKFAHDPVCVRQDGDEIFITCGNSKNICVVSSKTFQLIRSFSVRKVCYALDIINDQLCVACTDSIEVVDKNGTSIQSYVVEKNVECVIVIKQKTIAYSNYDKDIVTTINEKGNTLWTYTSPNLIFPYGLEKDSKDNIYIAGKDSNNIHVVSCDGDPLRVFDNIEKPWFTMIPPDDDCVCCVCSDNTKMTIYRIT